MPPLPRKPQGMQNNSHMKRVVEFTRQYGEGELSLSEYRSRLILAVGDMTDAECIELHQILDGYFLGEGAYDQK